MNVNERHLSVPTLAHVAPGQSRGGTSLWWATKNEWLGLIDVAGLELESLHGDFEGGPLTSDSTEYIFVARRPA